MIGESSTQEIVSHLDWTIELNRDIDTITRRYRVGSGYEERAIVNLDQLHNWRNAFSSAVAE